MRLITLGAGLALVGLQAVQAQVTIDITKLTCNQYLAGELTDLRTLGIWLNGYVNGARQDAHRASFRRTHQSGALLREPL